MLLVMTFLVGIVSAENDSNYSSVEMEIRSDSNSDLDNEIVRTSVGNGTSNNDLDSDADGIVDELETFSEEFGEVENVVDIISLYQQGEIKCGISGEEESFIVCRVSEEIRSDEGLADDIVCVVSSRGEIDYVCPENLDINSVNFEASQLELLSTVQQLTSNYVECPDGTFADSIGNCEGVLEEEYESADENRSDENNESVCTICKELDKSSPLIVQSVINSNDDNNSEENEEAELRTYFENKSSQELSGEEFGLYVALQAKDNENVNNLIYNNETKTLEVDHEEDVRIFGVFRLSTNVKTTVDSQGNVQEKYPWWSFLATKPNENEVKFKAGAELSK